MNTSINDKSFLRWRKRKAFLVQTLETMAQGQSDGYLNPYWDFPGDSSFNVFRPKEKLPQDGIGSAPQVEKTLKPKLRSDIQSVYETGIVGGAVDVGQHENLDLSAGSTALPQTPEAKKAEAERARMDETEATVLVMVIIMLALTVLAFLVLEAKIAR